MFPISELSLGDIPKQLQEIPDVPKQLYLRGNLPHENNRILTVVGSRKYSNYGKQVVGYLIDGLRGYPVSIISGLALGIDALAHEAALQAGLQTLAVPGSGLNDTVLYPRRNHNLARRILESGGGLLSEFGPTFQATTWSFPARNRIMAGLSHAVLVIEATEKSGTLITARLAVDYNRELLVVPGSIFSESTRGPHQFLKLGAIPITKADDILQILGIESPLKITDDVPAGLSRDETTVLQALTEPLERDELIRRTNLPIHKANILLMQMELKGLISEIGSQISKTS